MQDSSSVRSKDYTLHQMLLIKQVGQSQTDAKGLHPFGLDKMGAPICPNLYCRHLGHFFVSRHFIQRLRISNSCNIVNQMASLFSANLCLQIVLFKWFCNFICNWKNVLKILRLSWGFVFIVCTKVIKKTDKTGHLGTLMPCWVATSDNTMRRRVVVA